jgi:hypothetical protein
MSFDPMPEEPLSEAATTVSLYVIYDHPRDYPESFVVRRWDLEIPREVVGTAPTLEAARELVPPGLYNLERYEGDDPNIVEVWI